MELFDEEFLMSLGNKLGKPIRSGPKGIARFRREICEGLRTYQLEETIDFIQKHVRLSPKKWNMRGSVLYVICFECHRKKNIFQN